MMKKFAYLGVLIFALFSVGCSVPKTIECPICGEQATLRSIGSSTLGRHQYGVYTCEKHNTIRWDDGTIGTSGPRNPYDRD